MTKARVHVLESITQSNEPLSARQLCEQFKDEHDPATIYRALHFLEEKGRIESFPLYCTEHGAERYYVLHSNQHRHWFHCEQCHRFIDLGQCKFDAILTQMGRDRGLIITAHTFYATGICQECQAHGHFCGLQQQ